MNEKYFARMAASVGQRTALILGGLVLSLILLEAGFRLGGFILSSMQEYGNLRSIKQKGSYRILCLGESTTFNQYPRFLERILNEYGTGVHFSVIDKGRPGTRTRTIVDQVPANLALYRPDMVVTMMGINDTGPHMPRTERARSSVLAFFQHWKIYNLARFLCLRILTKAGKAVPHMPGPDGALEIAHDSTERSPKVLPDAVPRGNPSKRHLQNSKNPDVQQGTHLLHQGEFSSAEACFKKAIAVDPANSDAYDGLGWIFLYGKDPAESEYFFKKAIELDPENNSAFTGLGWFYSSRHKLPEAETAFEKAVELSPECSRTYSVLGSVYRLQRKLSEAEDILKKGLEIDPQDVGMLAALAALSEEMGKMDQAKAYLKKLKSLKWMDYSPSTAANYRELHDILGKNGIKLVCAQYPMRSLEPLKRIFANEAGVTFVDNEMRFKEAVKREGYQTYFRDMFAGDFGHCTRKGNELLAQNIADTILEKIFKL